MNKKIVQLKRIFKYLIYKIVIAYNCNYQIIAVKYLKTNNSNFNVKGYNWINDG